MQGAFSDAGTAKLKKIMTPDPITISEDATIALAAHTMRSTKVSGLPVVDPDGILAGIITESDIFRMVIKEWGKSTE
ncbi:MAG: CBS domain-containing protein [Gammaproteobacteria bacterium]|nr:CBS domain-containing protein [Gammaproteobacteria bacterium]MCI0590537.1 CBS domain-containing protein [Gammaproteobacteria bacterium]